MTTVGFIGLGAIGQPMALRLAASEHALLVYDVEPQAVAALIEHGAQATTVAEMAATCEVICVMVRDDVQVRDVLGQILGAAHDGLAVVIHSTVAPATPRQLEITAAKHGVLLVDAPVSGGPMGAAQGELAIMVGGSEEAFTTVEPVLQAMGSKVVHAGPIGAGTRLKLARNLMHFVAFTAATEAARLAEASGLDLQTLGEVVRHTDALTGGPGAILHRTTTAPIEPEDFWHGVFSHVADLGEKDLGFAVELAAETGTPVPLAELAIANLRTGLGL